MNEPRPDCIFCKVVSGEIPSTVVFRAPGVTAFRDLNPQSPTHILLVPNEHVENTEHLEEASDAALAKLVRTASRVARQEGIAESGYRLVINTGPDALNSVPHLHVHLLGGRRLGWPPG